MADNYQLTEPSTFEKGKDYVFVERREETQRLVLAVVEFINYDPCPAFIIVRDEMGKTRRCPREDLFVQVFHV